MKHHPPSNKKKPTNSPPKTQKKIKMPMALNARFAFSLAACMKLLMLKLLVINFWPGPMPGAENCRNIK